MYVFFSENCQPWNNIRGIKLEKGLCLMQLKIIYLHTEMDHGEEKFEAFGATW